jgi:hypothetical protein
MLGFLPFLFIHDPVVGVSLRSCCAWWGEPNVVFLVIVKEDTGSSKVGLL